MPAAKQVTLSDVGSWVHFYNLDLQEDKDQGNEFNFGADPYEVGKALAGAYFDDILRERMKEDPALAAAVMAWFDANLGTRFLGVFYEEAQRWVYLNDGLRELNK